MVCVENSHQTQEATDPEAKVSIQHTFCSSQPHLGSKLQSL